MILKDYLEAEEFLNESLFGSIIEEPLNEAFKSDIARKLAKSSVFKYFPEARYINIPSVYKDGDDQISKEEKKWRQKIGKNRKGQDLYTQLYKVQLDQLEDSDFEMINKADARRKKYADGYVFWMDDNDEIAAISTGNYVDLLTDRSNVFTGKILGTDDDFDPEGKDPYYMGNGGKYKNDDGEEIKYEKATKRVVSKDRATTLNLQKNPFIEYCYFLPDSIINKKRSNRVPYEREDTDDDIRRKNHERYEEEKVNRRKSKKMNILPEYNEKFQTLLVNPLSGQLEDFFKGIDQVKSGGLNPYTRNISIPNSIKKMENFFETFYNLVSAINRDYFYDRTKATETYEKGVQRQKEKIDEFLNEL